MVNRLTVLLATPFRLFFLTATIFGCAAMGLWVPVLLGLHGWSGAMPASIWHGHEMVFGYTMAVLAGFLLTAAANWTGTPPWRGKPLALLGLLWLAGRIAVNCSGCLPPVLTAIIDLSFIPALGVMLAIPLIATGNRRQYVFLVFLTLLTVANLLVHLEALGVVTNGGHIGLILAVDLLMAIISVMGGRVIPAFTTNALRQQGETILPKAHAWQERLALALMILLAVLDVVAETSPACALTALVAAMVQGLRLAGWRGHRTLGQPILWVLHLGFGWLVIGLFLKFIVTWFPGIPTSSALHALTIGVVGTLTLGMMSRVSLGHTGRAFLAGPFAVAAFIMITASALLRVITPWLPANEAVTDQTIWLFALAGLLWMASLAAFVIGHGGILTSPRIDGRPG